MIESETDHLRSDSDAPTTIEASRLDGKQQFENSERWGSWAKVVKFLVFLLPILVGIAILRSGHIPKFMPKATAPPSSSPACANPPLDNCSFYANCLEPRYQCGPSGYPLGYGQKYCEKFSNARSLFDPRGQQWMINTMHCLQIALVSDAIGTNATTCEALEDQAFGTHAGCYVDNGLCTLGVHDWLAIFEVVDMTTLFDSWDAFKATLEAVAECGEFLAFLIAKGHF